LAAQRGTTAASGSEGASTPAGTSEGPTMADVTPTPSPQADAAASEPQQ
jgi:hypothetical protein